MARMFVGHYGVSFAARRLAPRVPLWALFLAVQLLDVLWAPLVLLGIERVRISPGITASNPLDLYYMPYTHGLAAAALWSAAAAVAWRLLAPRRAGGGPSGGGPSGGGPSRGVASGALVVGAAVLSHWALDFLVHRPDLPLLRDQGIKVGLGLWNAPAVAFALEAGLLLGGLALYLRAHPARRLPMLLFAGAMLAVHATAFFGAPPRTPEAAAVVALGSYLVLALAAGRLERRALAEPGG